MSNGGTWPKLLPPLGIALALALLAAGGAVWWNGGGATAADGGLGELVAVTQAARSEAHAALSGRAAAFDSLATSRAAIASARSALARDEAVSAAARRLGADAALWERVEGGLDKVLGARRQLAELETARADLLEPRHHLMAASYGGKVYVFGGASSLIDWRAQSKAWAYDPAADSWAEVAPMPEPRLAGAALTLGDYIYIVGGTAGSNALLRYDPARDQWTKLASLSESREHTAAAALDGKIYAIGGRWSGKGELTSVEVYDPDRDSWMSGPSLQTARGGFASLTANGKIYALGGEVLTGANQALTSVEVLDLEKGAWKPGPSLPLPLHGVPAVSVEDVIYVLGGADRPGAISNQGLVFSLKP